MGILQRFQDIMSSNINAMLDKLEDPSKMIDQILRELNEDSVKIKNETAGVMADEQKAKRQYDECLGEITKLQDYAKKALERENENDARQFLTKKSEYVQKEITLKQNYILAQENSLKMRQMHDKIQEQINDLNSRKDTIKTKLAMAKTQEKINTISDTSNKINGSLSSFERMEDKANKAYDSANAMYELNKSSNDIEDLTSKYDTSSNTDIDNELNALKEQMLKDKYSN